MVGRDQGSRDVLARITLLHALLLAVLLTPSCAGSDSGQDLLTAEMPLHLEDHLDAATIDGSDVVEGLIDPVEWRFDEPQPEWKPVIPLAADRVPVQMTRTEDALRVVLTEASALSLPNANRTLQGGIYSDLPDWHRDDWAYVVVEARATQGGSSLTLMFNLLDEPTENPRGGFSPEFQNAGEYVNVIGDGNVHTYMLRADWADDRIGAWMGDSWRQLGLQFSAGVGGGADDTGSPGIEILSVSVIPKGADYAAAPAGVRTEVRNQAGRRTLYTHTPARLTYRVRVPNEGRLDVGLGVLRDDIPITFRVDVASENDGSQTLLDEVFGDKERWAQRSVDLSHLAGQAVTLVLEAKSDVDGAVALWAAPTLSGADASDRPNVIFYVIDGAAANNMSVYGYNRHTTPNLERIAAEGAVFEHAYSNSTWTKPSTPSFMTSLQHSVLGGYRNENDPLPDQAVTIAQHMHGAGYQTAVFSTNPYVGIMSSLDRGVDVLREAGVAPNSASSRVLHDDFWRWREAYPAQPYWVHFQTTDVHWPRDPQPPVAGLFVTPERRAKYDEWEQHLGLAPAVLVRGRFDERLRELGIDRAVFFDDLRGLYDETMAHQDYQLGRLVERLKSTGEWKDTLLIVAADHGSTELVGVLDPEILQSSAALFDWAHHIPMIFVWPERIAPGRRFDQTVSMIDMLPTILDLAGLPLPEIYQGQSLAPLLLGDEGWKVRPTIINEFYVSDGETGEMSGGLQVIDGRWRAGMNVSTSSAGPPPEGAPSRLRLWDTWAPFSGNLNEERPDLVEKYTRLLEETWRSHQVLGAQFTRSGGALLTPEQLRTLRSLGYIQ